MEQLEHLESALLEVLASASQPLSPAEVYAAIERRCPLNGDEKRHIPTSRLAAQLKEREVDWRNLPEAELRRKGPTEPRWKNSVRWVVKSLRSRGLMVNASPDRRWSLTAAGRLQAQSEQPRGPRTNRRPSRQIETARNRLLQVVNSMSNHDVEQLLEMAVRLKGAEQGDGD